MEVSFLRRKNQEQDKGVYGLNTGGMPMDTMRDVSPTSSGLNPPLAATGRMPIS
jgi:hypothetical protein